MNEPTNNKELAHAYFLVTAQLIDGQELHFVGCGRNKIKNYSDNIVDIYKTHGSLETLPGFQREKRTLELILKKGVYHAREKVYEKRVRQLQQKPFEQPAAVPSEEFNFYTYFMFR